MAITAFDPKSVELKMLDERDTFDTAKDFQNFASQYAGRLMKEQESAGEKNWHCVHVVHRKTGDVRVFNLLSMRHVNGQVENNPAALEFACQLLLGKWRLAKPDEVKAEYERQAEYNRIQAGRATDADAAKAQSILSKAFAGLSKAADAAKVKENKTPLTA